MLASELVKKMQLLMAMHGNFEVFTDDGPYEYPIDKIEFRRAEEKEYWPDCRPRETKIFPDRIVLVTE